jgi:hypothetical protein
LIEDGTVDLTDGPARTGIAGLTETDGEDAQLEQWLEAALDDVDRACAATHCENINDAVDRESQPLTPPLSPRDDDRQSLDEKLAANDRTSETENRAAGAASPTPGVGGGSDACEGVSLEATAEIIPKAEAKSNPKSKGKSGPKAKAKSSPESVAKSSPKEKAARKLKANKKDAAKSQAQAERGNAENMGNEETEGGEKAANDEASNQGEAGRGGGERKAQDAACEEKKRVKRGRGSSKCDEETERRPACASEGERQAQDAACKDHYDGLIETSGHTGAVSSDHRGRGRGRGRGEGERQAQVVACGEKPAKRSKGRSSQDAGASSDSNLTPQQRHSNVKETGKLKRKGASDNLGEPSNNTSSKELPRVEGYKDIRKFMSKLSRETKPLKTDNARMQACKQICKNMGKTEFEALEDSIKNAFGGECCTASMCTGTDVQVPGP